MDWSKAKTILIVAFLVTNLMMVFFIMSGEKVEDTTLSDDFIDQVEAMLLEKDIKLNVDIPRISPSLPPIIVEYESLIPVRINEAFFQGEGRIDQVSDNLIEISYEDEIIRIKNDKVLEYENNGGALTYKDLDKKKAETIAMDFIREKKFKRENMRLNAITYKDGVYIVRFSKFYDNKYVEKAYLNIGIDGTGVRFVQRLWLDIKGDGEKEIFINTAPKALLSLLDMEEAWGRTIEDISLCHYFDPNQHGYLDTPTDAKKGKTIPAWRLSLDNGGSIIIDNY